MYLYPDDYPVWFQGHRDFLKAIWSWWHPCGPTSIVGYSFYIPQSDGNVKAATADVWSFSSITGYLRFTLYVTCSAVSVFSEGVFFHIWTAVLNCAVFDFICVSRGRCVLLLINLLIKTSRECGKVWCRLKDWKDCGLVLLRCRDLGDVGYSATKIY